jgi:hypothetical protein
MLRNFHSLGLRFVFATLLAMALAGCMAAQTSAPGRIVPPVWTPSYNAEQGPLPDTSDWPVVIRGKHVAVRLAPGSDWSQYREIAAGEVRYTGSEIKLTPRQIAELTDLLQTRLDKDLRQVKLAPAPGAAGKLKVDANITDAKATLRKLNLASESVGVIGAADVGAASVTAWVRDGKTQQVVASVEMAESGKHYQRGIDLSATGQTRLALREESRTLAQILTQVAPALAAEKTKTPAR